MFIKLALLVAATSVATLPAQSPAVLAGLAADDAGVARPGLLAQPLDGTCSPAVVQWNANFAPPSWYAGGTCHDLRRDTLWGSDGVSLFELDRATGVIRSTVAHTPADPAAFISGLTLAGNGDRLVVLETIPGRSWTSSYQLTATNAVALGDVCTLTLRPGAVAAAIAYDAENHRFYQTVSSPTTGGGWSTGVLGFDASARCVPVCGISVPPSPGVAFDRANTVVGMTFDTGRRELHLTNGRTLQSFSLDSPPCGLRPLGWCEWNAAVSLRGLTLVPSTQRSDLGIGCAASACSHCANPRADLLGTPAIGNLGFSVALEDGPSGGSAILLLSTGVSPGGQFFPFVCGPLYPDLGSAALFGAMQPLVGARSCDGRTHFDLPIPWSAALSAQRLCVQWIVACGNSASFGSSQAIDFTLTSR
ncbi:MAG: hypothetical protein AB7I19_10185 [Planctomycetota bacterium]